MTLSGSLREHLTLAVLGGIARISPRAPRLWRRIGLMHAAGGLQHCALRASATAIVDRVSEFLGLPPCQLPSGEPVNQAFYPAMAPEVAQRPRTWLAPHQAALRELMGDRLP